LTRPFHALVASRTSLTQAFPMKTCLWHWSLGSMVGGLIALALFAVVWAARHEGDFSRLSADPEPLLIAVVLSALASGLAAVLISRLSRRPIVQIVKVAAAPAPAPVFQLLQLQHLQLQLLLHRFQLLWRRRRLRLRIRHRA
jgi:hypothetical protein